MLFKYESFGGKKNLNPMLFISIYIYIFFTSLIMTGIPLYFGMDTFLLQTC